MKDKINVLGTEYRIVFKSDEEIAEDMKANVGEYGGYCNEAKKIIAIALFDKCEGEDEESKAYLTKWNLRHEITHAFLNESGLSSDSDSAEHWAKSEEIVDWFAIQSPKIYKVFAELDILR